jgi:hypothetical protein
MSVSGNARATGRSVSVVGDGHFPAVWGIKAGEPLLLRVGAGFFCGGPGGSTATGRSGVKKGGRISYDEGAWGKATGGEPVPEPGGSGAGRRLWRCYWSGPGGSAATGRGRARGDYAGERAAGVGLRGEGQYRPPPCRHRSMLIFMGKSGPERG